MSKYLGALLVVLLFSIVSLAQTGKISGKILNEKNEPLQGVSIKIEGAARGTSSDVEGRYTLTLPTGIQHTIKFSAVGYEEKVVDEVVVAAGENVDLPVILKVASKDLGEVTVTATRSTLKKETVNSLIQFQKNTNTVASVISAESIRRSPDRNTGEVLKRTPGASLVEGKFLVVRGLADRYNLAMLNGVSLSSTEPDRKTFSFDLIPANMIDNIIINKAFVPEFPAEWAGGLIQVNTKDVPSQNFFNIQIGTGFNTQSISNDFYSYKGGKYDFLGLDDGFRNLPSSYKNKSDFNSDGKTFSQKSEVARGLKNVWTGNKVSLPINQQFQASTGFNTKIFGNKGLGGIFALTYNRQMRYTKNETNDNNINADGTYSKNIDYDDDRYSEDVLWGALGNLSLQLNSDNKINVKTLFNVNANKYITNRTGTEDFGNVLDDSVRANELTFHENIFFNGQISGDHNLYNNKYKFHWYGTFNALSGNQPDQRRLMYTKNNDEANSRYLALISDNLSQRTGSRLYQNLSDYVYTAGGDLSRSFDLFGLKQTIKGGYLFQVKDRLFDARFFSTAVEGNPVELKSLPPDQIFRAENFGNGSDGLFKFDMIKGGDYRYVANTILNAGFIQFDNQFTEKLRAVWGLRVENYDQLVGSVRRSSEKFSYTEVRDFLPGVNITYKLNSKTNIRASGSQTVVRPEFRELAPFTFYDFDLNGTVTGSKALVRTKVTNGDLRYEIYPRAGEVITFGVFYKHFNDPIIQRLNKVSGNTFLYDNATKGYTYGPEFELRKRLDFISERLTNLTFHTNLSYIKSNIKQIDFQGRTLFDDAFQGQSNYLINAGILYDLPKSGLSTTLLFNQIGRRIAFYGDPANGQPAIWEGSRPILDFQIAKKVMKGKGEVKMNVSDIFNQRLYFYQNVDDKVDFDKSVDAVRFSRKYGTNFSFTFGYSL
ncbi:MAG: carboxypeptidase-like regulatory domain-containing protein [Chitinophagaceae bacterium]|nr:carboxypeptidase-like regulatory domain-containing protein [Chitinophagaceae bacterium]